MLVLLPAPLSAESSSDIFSPSVQQYITEIDHYVVENQKTARRTIKFHVPEKSQQSLQLYDLNKDTSLADLADVQQLLHNGVTVGLLSEAGLPCIADPGAKLVAWCHRQNIRVIPLPGPSSIILALIASGMNGQQFQFHGYLPIDKAERRKSIAQMESASQKGMTQIFMETPYRNLSMLEDLMHAAGGETYLCVAAAVTSDTEEFIKTKKIRDWKKQLPSIHKIPTIFLMGQPQ